MTAASETVLAHFPLMCAGTESDTPDLQVVAPFDRAPIATVATANARCAEAALTTAYALFRDRDAWLSPGRRTEILERAATIMHERAETLAVEAAREGGKPLIDSRVAPIPGRNAQLSDPLRQLRRRRQGAHESRFSSEAAAEARGPTLPSGSRQSLGARGLAGAQALEAIYAVLSGNSSRHPA